MLYYSVSINKEDKINDLLGVPVVSFRLSTVPRNREVIRYEVLEVRFEGNTDVVLGTK